MTRGALCLAAVRVRRVALREVGRVEPAPVLTGVAVGAELLTVASFAGKPAGGCLRSVRQAESIGMDADFAGRYDGHGV